MLRITAITYHGAVEVVATRFVPVLKSNDLRDDIFELVNMILTYFAGIKEVAVFLRQSASEFWCGHEVDCLMSELFA